MEKVTATNNYMKKYHQLKKFAYLRSSKCDGSLVEIGFPTSTLDIFVIIGTGSRNPGKKMFDPKSL